ncbi:putative 50S ribosomal protein L22 [Dioszegia hungarica]|uniref:50S ribosomal protein L22 n=1 Tax=Dioszegia hungarica TaxID=4972 RepID=A0AA38HE91_9TREE|nr:putative 50S ribosomal protein L22 [Dioszegia hungarica]KAI9637284.1 putative 50S ribosomal protein L22 [Dioszegia hungarica]
MTRPFRSVVSLAQTAQALAGPSTFRPLRPALPLLSQPSSSRSASFSGWEQYVPSILRPKRKTATPAVVERTSETSVDIPQEELAATSTGSLFEEIAQEVVQSERRRKATQHRYSTAQHKISPRKLNDLSRQISGLPIDEAIVQMQFSEKRASSWIKSTLCLARDHALDKGLERGRLIVAESWTSKGPKIKRVDIKGRGRAGIKYHPLARLHVLLKEGKTRSEKDQRRFQKELGLVRSAGVVREDGVLRRKVVSGWAW